MNEPSNAPTPRAHIRVPISRQRELFARHARAALADLTTVLAARGEELVELATERAFDTVGVDEYGDQSYHIAADRLTQEMDAELADAIFYRHIALARQAGDLDDVPVDRP